MRDFVHGWVATASFASTACSGADLARTAAPRIAPLRARGRISQRTRMFRHMPRCYATGLMAPRNRTSAASKAAALSVELRAERPAVIRPPAATLCRLGGGSSVGRAPGCGPGGAGSSPSPPSLSRPLEEPRAPRMAAREEGKSSAAAVLRSWPQAGERLRSRADDPASPHAGGSRQKGCAARRSRAR